MTLKKQKKQTNKTKTKYKKAISRIIITGKKWKKNKKPKNMHAVNFSLVDDYVKLP